MSQYHRDAHGDADFMDYYIEQFERDAGDYLVDATRLDVGAVMLYYRAGAEIAYFDYENLVGSVYELGGTTASYCP